MMKKILLLLLLLILIISSFLLFHDKGNEYLKPYVSGFLEKKLGAGADVEVEHLKIDFNYVELTALLNNLTKVHTQGDVSFINHNFDMNYTLSSNVLNNQTDIKGTLVGTAQNMRIQGEGQTLKSHINYALNLKDDVIHNIKIKMDKADIASLLTLASKPAYAQGKVDIDIDIPTFEALETKGNAKIVLHETLLNPQVFKKEFNIDLPKTKVTAKLNSKVNANTFEIEGDIKSNLAWLKLSKMLYSTKTNLLKSNYRLIVPQLSKLHFLSKQKLSGQLQLNGTFKLQGQALSLQGSSKDLGGEVSFDYNAQRLHTSIDEIEIAKLLHMLNEQPFAKGKLTAQIKLDNLKNLKGNYKLETKNAKTIQKTFRKRLNLNLGGDTNFVLKSKGEIASNFIEIQSDLDSDLFIYHSTDMTYDLAQRSLKSSYTLNIPKLSKLNALAGKKLKGELSLLGVMNYAKALNITATSKSLGGEIDFDLKGKLLNAKIQNVSVEKLIHMLSYPKVFKANLLGNLTYDLASKQGTFNSKLTQAQLLPNQLTDLVKQLRGIDLTKERYTQTTFNALLNDNIIDITFNAKSKKVLLSIPSGRINKATNQINASYKVDIDNMDLGGEIQGNIANPKVSINSSDYLQTKVIDVIKENIPQETLKELGLEKINTKEIKDAVRNLLGDLFK